MKLTFIGAGNIGGAAAIGLARSSAVPAGDIVVTALHEKSLKRFAKYGISTSLDNIDAVKGADIVFFAVKPWQMEAVAAQTKYALDYDRQLIVSIAPGVSADNLKKWFEKAGTKPSIAYVIPNTAIEIGESMTFISPVTASDGQAALLKKLFDKVGKALVVPLNRMVAGTCVASCGIAYAMRYISASEKGARTLGLAENDIQKVVCQTVVGASELIRTNNSDPEKEIDKVTTPNGMTIKGLNAMEDAGFSAAVQKGLTVDTRKKRRIVVKVGSNVLTRHDGALDTTRVSSIVDQIVAVRRQGFEVVLVTSGAVACGRSLIRQNDKLDDVQQRQLYSAIGQVRLMDLYYKLFIDYGINVGQILTMKKNFSTRREYNNQRNCVEVMLQSGVVPVVNENDTVSIKELMFTDNDELSGLVATMVGAEALIILSNVDGVYSGDPSSNGSAVVPVLRCGEDYDKFITDSKSEFGRGGMTSKCHIASTTAASGVKVIIANGKRDNIIVDVLTRPESTVHTEFLPE